ncbi:MAG: sulfite exporter TauE/SafE family protein [Anaerolineales bacterium]|nr:MAG: sulfite exporter TauE/SafE family protein [Anaerolineales bacterium]
MLASFLLGLLGSLAHCAGMCSAVIILFGRQSIFQNKFAWLLAHAGRITTYSFLGLIFGMFGQTIFALDTLQASLSIIFGIVAFYMASAFIGLAPSPELMFSGLSQRWGKAIRSFKTASLPAAYLLGLLWGLLPCGLVLTALVAAMASGNALLGALTMFIFGVATIPSLFAVKWLAGKSISRIWSRGLASLVMMFFGFQFAMRGFASLGWVEHFALGPVMFW